MCLAFPVPLDLYLRIPPCPTGKAYFLFGLLRPYKAFLFPFTAWKNIFRIKLLDGSPTPYTDEVFSFLNFVCLFLLFRVAPEAYGSSQARGWIRASIAGLQHRHSNTGSKPCLQPTPRPHSNAGSLTLWGIRPGIELRDCSEARDQTRILMDTSWVR